MINNIVDFEIDGVPYEAVANIGAMYKAEKLGGKPFMQLLVETQKGFLEPFVVLLSTCVRVKGEKTPLGLDTVCELNQDTFQDFLEPLLEAVLDALPKDKDNKGSQKKK